MLAGTLSEIEYSEVAPGEGKPIWRHSYRRVGRRQFAFGATELVQLCPTTGERPRVHVAGARSGGTHHHIHTFYASETPAVTLLRVGPSLTPTSAVYRATAEPPPVTTPRPATRGDVRDWIDQVMQMLAS